MPRITSFFLHLTLSLLITQRGALASDASPDLEPISSEKGKLLFKDDFDETTIKSEWYAKHGTNWKVVNGVLTGRPASQEFQKKRISEGNKAHSGRSPAGRLLVPTQDCILLLRFKMSDGLTEAHFGFDDGKMGTQHLGRLIASARSFIAIQRDKNAKVEDDQNRILAKSHFDLKPERWYWMMLEVIGGQMTAQLSGAPVLKATDTRFALPKSHINLPARGAGGTITYDHVRVWEAKPKKSNR